MSKDLALVGWVLVALVLTLVLGSLALTTRRMAIRRPGGAVTCSLRQDGDLRWRHGVVAYRTSQLFWFRSFGVGLRPDAVFDRHALRPVERRAAGADAIAAQADRALERGTTVVRFDTGAPDEALWLALSPDALTGLLAWVEAAPQPWFGSLS